MSKSSNGSTSTQAVVSQQQPKIYGKLSKKVSEVREVVQNKSDVDIAKVLEYFDLDVGKTIDAFVTDNGKEALAKWSEKKRQRGEDSQSHQSNNINSELDQESNGDASRNQAAASNRKNHNKQNGGKKNNNLANSSNSSMASSSQSKPGGLKPFNINELVASVINKYTSGNTPPVPTSIPATTNNSLNSSELEKRLTETLKLENGVTVSAASQVTAISNSSSSSTIIPTSSSSLSASQIVDAIPPTFGGVKITVLGIQTANSMNTISSTPKPGSHAASGNTVNDSASFVSSTTSSPSSMSIVSTSSAFSNPAVQINGVGNGSGGARPYLLELKQNGAQPVNLFSNAANNNLPRVNKNYFNQRAGKDVQLERLQRDLNRQQSQLTKICNQYEEQMTRDRALLTSTFAEIRRLLDARERELDRQLVASAQQGAKILQNRQAKAAWLKVLSDNARHLNDQEIGELKSDIKHFVSERQLDEEFSGVRFISFDNAANSDRQLAEKINSTGVVNQVVDKYSKSGDRATADSSSNSTPVHVSTSSLVPSSASSLSSSTSHSPLSSQKQQQNGINGTVDKNNNHNKHNGSTNGNNETLNANGGGFENEFIEVKKPQRNRNKNKPSSDQANNSQQQSSQAPAPQQPQQHSKANGNMKTALNNGTAVNVAGTNNSNRAMLNGGRQVYAK